MKKHRKRSNTVRKPYIPMQNWSTGHVDESLLPQRITGYDCEIDQVPDLSIIDTIIKEGKNGKAAGLDNIHMELIKYASEGTIEELKQLFKRIWLQNEIPQQWKESLLVPIPKVAHPKGIEDYRRICLSSVGYKIYASWILRELMDKTTPIGSHQAAFLQGRSTMDHAFVTKRVLEERWNAGDDTIVMALDISKAFDKVSLLKLPETLRKKSAPPHLIARTIECIREESFQTLWDGQKSRSERRCMGIKQGCPLSPYLFDLIIEDALQAAQQEIGESFTVDQETSLKFPIILVYADDILIIAQNVEQLNKVIPIILNHLQKANLLLNKEKTKVLIRTPLGTPPAQITVANDTYDVTSELTYLGITITSTLNRPKTMRARCKKAIRASKIAVDFARKNKPSLEIVKILYDSIVAPTMFHGSQISTLTKRNRLSMRKYEKQIVKELASCCVSPEGRITLNQLLGGKTITKKIRALQMRYWSHIVRTDDSHILKLAAKYKKSYKKRGRPAFTWIDLINQNMDRFGDLSREEWEQLALDKEKVTQKIEGIYTTWESADSDEDVVQM